MIWLIGNRGMLGTEVARQLEENKIDFISGDCEVDITDFSAVDLFVKNHGNEQISFIINCAAYTAVDNAEEDEEKAFRINADGPGNIARVAKTIGATVIHISTDYVFDGTNKTPYTEEDEIAPIGAYGRTKAGGEKAISKETDSFYILRTAWLYGWAGKNFVYTMIRAMNTYDSVKVVSDQRGTPTFCGTLAGVIMKIIVSSTSGRGVPFGIYHVTDEGETNWFEFTKEIQKQASGFDFVPNVRKCTVNSCSTSDYPTKAKRPEYSVLSKAKIQNTLGIRLPEWQESLALFLGSEMFDIERVK
ncbi:MAG: dTDP-4-dehydrorhamnose reductase [Treponema sp.]|nr:dTDP-4-dehydrorhamnose reductase [Treponema sp.]